MSAGRVLVIGGSRSGKSAFAERLLADAATVDYVATATTIEGDDEWDARVARHQARRPVTWRTVETGDIAGELGRDGAPALVDSVTTWLARVMEDAGSWTEPPHPNAKGALTAALDRLIDAWTGAVRAVVAVTDEVGSGVVPDTESGRLFRDTLGELNQRLAKVADEVYFARSPSCRRVVLLSSGEPMAPGRCCGSPQSARQWVLQLACPLPPHWV
jgi:adenosylcobinamide kinase/adenosylcobinamide-phosphate guanylyltransferase